MNSKTIFALLVLAVLPASSQVIIQGGVQIGSGSSSGVGEIIPGTNVTCTPLVSGSCTGNVTVNSTGGSGSNWGASKTLALLGDSRFIVSSTYIVSNLDTGIVTASSVSGSTITLTTTNTQTAANALILVSGFSACPALIGQTVIVSGTGLSGSSLQAGPVTGASGSCGTGTFVGRDTAQYQLTTMANTSGATIVNYAVAGGTAASICPSVSSYLPAESDGLHWVAIQLGSIDLASSGGLGQRAVVKGLLQQCWAGAHARGWKVIATTLIPTTPFNLSSPTAYEDQSNVSTWMQGQGLNSGNIIAADGKYWDALADPFETISDPLNVNDVMQFGCTSPCDAQHLTWAGNLKLAAAINMAAGQSTMPELPHKSSQSIDLLSDASGQSNAQDLRLATNDNGFGLDAVVYNRLTLGHGAGVTFNSLEYGTLDNATELAWLPETTIRGFAGDLVTHLIDVGDCRDTALANTLDIVNGPYTCQPYGILDAAAILAAGSTVTGTSTVNGPSNINGQQTIVGGQTITQNTPSNPALVLKGQSTGIHIYPVLKSDNTACSSAAAGNITVPCTLPASATLIVTCLHGTGDTVSDGIGGDPNFTQVATISVGGFTDIATFVLTNSLGGSATIAGCPSYWNTFDAFTGGAVSSIVDGTPSGAGVAYPASPLNTGTTTASSTGFLYTVAITSSDHAVSPFLAPSGFTKLYSAGSGYNGTTAWAPYTAGTYSAAWNATGLQSGDYAGAIIVALKGVSQTGDTGDHQQNRKSDGTLQGGVTGAGDVFVINTAAGLILKDTVAGTCSRGQLTSGVLVWTTVSCPN